MTVLLSFEEKADDARACAQSGHCPFKGLVFGGAYIRRGLSTEGNLRFKIDRASLIVGSIPF